VRRAIKGVQLPKLLEKELPNCAVGALLLLWISQVRKAANKAASLRQAEAAVAAATKSKAETEEQLAAAKQEKVCLLFKGAGCCNQPLACFGHRMFPSVQHQRKQHLD
jgi:hypothetical protein